MHKSFFFFLFIAACQALSLGGGITPSWAMGPENPDPVHILVQQNGRRIILKAVGFEDNVNTTLPSHDTSNFIWAFSRLVPGGAIILEGKTYHISHPISVKGFQGRLIGAGMNKTVLAARGPYMNDHYVFPSLSSSQAQDHLIPAWPYIFIFANRPQEGDGVNWRDVSTHLTMEHFTLTVVGRGPQQTYFGINNVPFETHSVKGAILVIDSHPNLDRSVHKRIEHFTVDISNVYIYGQGEGEATGTNLEQGILIYGAEQWLLGSNYGLPLSQTANGWIETDHLPVNMVVHITNCRVFNTWLQGIGVETPITYPGPNTDLQTIYGLTFPSFAKETYPSSSIIISNNVFTRVARGTIAEPSSFFASFVLSPSGTYIVWSNNIFYEQSGRGIAIAAGQGDTITGYTQQPSPIFVEHNIFYTMPPANPSQSFNGPAVFIADLNALQPPVPVKATCFITVQFNEFHAEVGYSASLVEHYTGAGLTVVNNTFHGEASTGISVGASKVYDGQGNVIAVLPVFGDVVNGNDFDNFIHSAQGADVLAAPLCLGCSIDEPGDNVVA